MHNKLFVRAASATKPKANYEFHKVPIEAMSSELGANSKIHKRQACRVRGTDRQAWSDHKKPSRYLGGDGCVSLLHLPPRESRALQLTPLFAPGILIPNPSLILSSILAPKN